jgi:hypothetical protein
MFSTVAHRGGDGSWPALRSLGKVPSNSQQEKPETSMQLKSCGLALALAIVPLTALAQSTTAPKATPEEREKMRAACAADVQKFCADVERGKGAMRTCLEAHQTQLSDSCRDARAERAAARAKDKG